MNSTARLIQLPLWGCAVLIAGLLVACAQESVSVADVTPPTVQEPTIAPTSMATLTPSPTSTPTPTVTPSLKPSPTGTASTTLALEDWRISDDFLFGEQTEDCTLPCWQGLRVGRSTDKDIQEAFNYAFGLDRRPIFPDSYDPKFVIEPNLYAPYLGWELAESPRIFFSVQPWLNIENGILQSLTFNWNGDQFQKYLSPGRIIKELGRPDFVYIGVHYAESAESSSSSLLLIYESGIAFTMDNVTGIEARPLGDNRYDEYLYLCFDEQERLEILGSNTVFITEPFSSELDNLTPVQEFIISHTVEASHRTPVNDFGVTIDEFTEAAMQDQCITLDIPGY